MFEKINLDVLLFELGTYTLFFAVGIFTSWFFTGLWWGGLFLGGFINFVLYCCYDSVKKHDNGSFIRKSKEKEWWTNYRKNHGYGKEELEEYLGIKRSRI